MTRQGLNRSLGMIPFIRFHGTDDGQTVHVLGDARKNFGNLDSGSVGRDRFETGVALDIPTVQMADPALEPDQDDSLSFGLGSGDGQQGEPQELADC